MTPRMCTLTISVLGPKYGNRPRVKSMALFAQLVLAALWLEQVSEGKKQRQDANMARRSAWKGSIRIYHFWWKCLRALWKSGHRRLGFPVCIVVIVMRLNVLVAFIQRLVRVVSQVICARFVNDLTGVFHMLDEMRYPYTSFFEAGVWVTHSRP